MNRKIMALLAVALTLSVAFVMMGIGTVMAEDADGDNVIYAAYQKINGMLRIISSPDDARPSEEVVSWNKEGPTGPQGTQGEQGPQGIQGPPGPTPFAGQSCPENQFVTGFDDEGNIICSSIGGEEPPPPPPTPPSGAGKLVINEIDYDQPFGDTAEFVEIYNAGGDAVPLAEKFVELLDGSTAFIYGSYDLSLAGDVLPPGGYLVIGSPSVLASLDASVLRLPLTGSIQNGPSDGLALADYSIFSPVIPVTDGLSYGGFVLFATENEPHPGLPSGSELSLGRIPNGNDTNNNAADFALTLPTPGSANILP